MLGLHPLAVLAPFVAFALWYWLTRAERSGSDARRSTRPAPKPRRLRSVERPIGPEDLPEWSARWRNEDDPRS